jgi:hypothetical protein
VRSTFFTLTLGAGAQTPAEVALCLSFKAAPGSTSSPRTSRGRVYLGPFTTEALGSTLNSEVRPSVALQNAIADAGLRLASSSAHKWAVRSRVAGVLSEITEMWVDNAFDTQRRRGGKPQTRVSRSLNV